VIFVGHARREGRWKIGKTATHDMLKTTQVTKTAPIFAISLPCYSVLA
jgi:hypothetical protein